MIDLPGTSARELAKSAGVHRSTLTSTLKRLERKDFIFIDKNHQDGRKIIISITRLGKERLEAIETLFENELENKAGIESEFFILQDLIARISKAGQALTRSQTAILANCKQPFSVEPKEC